ncbi:MAG: hypothetical protein HQK49_03500 [Oligoflexia bacterium]|nr:hypothetical protein [Oligoflexia bacterium]
MNLKDTKDKDIKDRFRGDLDKSKKNESKAFKDNEISERYYLDLKFKKIIWIVVPIIFLFVGFFINFQLKSLLLSKQDLLLRQVLPCEIHYSDSDIKAFLPGLIFKNVLFPKECFGLPGILKLDKVSANFSGIGIYPYFGLKFDIVAIYGKSVVKLYSIVSYKKLILKLEDTILNLEDFIINFDSWPKISGELVAKSFIKIKNNKTIDELHLNLKIKNLQMPGMNITGLEIPPLIIGNLFLEAHQESNNRIKVSDFSVGDKNSPIVASFNGFIELNNSSITNSVLDLKGGVKFSEGFLKDFPILPLLMKKYTTRNDFYQIKVEGTLVSPLANPI